MTVAEDNKEPESDATLKAESCHTALEAEKVTMERHVGLFGSMAMVFGSIVGSGIFVSPTGIAVAAKSEGLSMLMWGIGGVISMIGSLSLAELSSVIPKSAGDYNYLRDAYAKFVGFMFAWNEGLMLQPSSQAISAITCATYVLVPLFDDGCGAAPDFYVNMLGASVILLLTACNAYSVRLSNHINIVFSAAKVLALAVITVGGIVWLANGKTQNLTNGFNGSNKQAGEIIMGFYSAMYAYSGWTSLNYITEEIINPKRNIPLTFYITMPLITVLYVMVNISYFTVMSVDDLLASPAVAITWGQAVLPGVVWLMPLCVAISTFGSTNATVVTLQRLFYVMGREGEMPKALSYLHHSRKTPLPALYLDCILAIIYVILGDVASLIDFLSFAYWISVCLVQLSVIVLRYRMPDAPRTYKVPIIFPITVFIFGVTLVIVPVVDAPQIEFLYATILMLASMLFYIPLVVYDKKPSYMKSVTAFIQMFLNVVPPTYTDMHALAKGD